MRLSFLAAIILFHSYCFAQPANDNPCGAVNIPVIESADGCTPQSYTITNATYLNLAVPNACGTVNPDVWYSFTATRNYMYISVSGPVQMQLYTAASCSVTFLQEGSVNCFSGSEISFGISTGTLYYMRISNTANNGNFTFTTCVTTKYPSKDQRVGINTKTPQYNFDVKGRAYFTDSTEFLRSVKFYSGIEVRNALKLSLPSAGINKILTSDVDGHASWQSLNIPAPQWILNNNNIYNANAGNVGIGTNRPLARLHVADSSVVFTGPTYLTFPNEFEPPVQGAGSRMMWFPQKAAFRVGLVEDNQWDKTNIGAYSFATGLNTKAKGDFAQSLGYETSAIGTEAFSSGFKTTATGASASSMGYYTEASGFAAVSMGGNTNAKATYSTAMGAGTIAESTNSLVIGTYNDTTNNNRYFEVGIGIDNTRRNNAFTILKNGNIGIGTTTPTGPLAFKNEVGNKIVLYGNAAAQYGVGIQGAALQLYTDVPGSNILFGSGSSGNFSERMRIINTGADGLQISGRIVLKNGTGSLNDPPGIWFYKADNSAQLGFFGTRDLQNIGFFGGPAGWGFVYDALNSRVGIGTANPSQALHVIGNIISSGTITPSDVRFKKDIALLTNPLQKIMQLNGVTYQYRSGDFPDMKFNNRQQVGLIAQDVEKVFPQLVFEDNKGYKAVDYVKLIPLLIEAIKEQQKEIEALKTSK
jgi:Chaperone of endosialidase